MEEVLYPGGGTFSECLLRIELEDGAESSETLERPRKYTMRTC